jgi:hypothetical protein
MPGKDRCLTYQAFAYNMIMNKREALIEDHKEMLEIRKGSIRRFWANRHKEIYHVRWLIEQAQTHKHMIEQLKSLPDMKRFSLFEQTIFEGR